MESMKHESRAAEAAPRSYTVARMEHLAEDICRMLREEVRLAAPAGCCVATLPGDLDLLHRVVVAWTRCTFTEDHYPGEASPLVRAFLGVMDPGAAVQVAGESEAA